jgi:hypothetical protein
MALTEEYLIKEVTMEQAAAVRAILKLEHIYRTGQVLSPSNSLDTLEKLESTILLSDAWGQMDRPFGHAMLNAVLSDQPITINSVIRVRLGKIENEMVTSVLNSGNFHHTIEEARSSPVAAVHSFVSVVLIQRNIKALKIIFAVPKPANDGFWFHQNEKKGLAN